LRVAREANPLFVGALAFAVDAHGTALQARKGTAFPYVVHPIRVAETLYLFGCNDNVVLAGLLHDVIEDTGVTHEQIAVGFGDRVAELVAGASEPDKTAPWRERKQHTLDSLRDSDRDTLLLVAADKLDNVRSLQQALLRRGTKAWDDFSAGPDEQRWYYRSLAEALLEREPNSLLVRAFDFEVRAVFPDEPVATRFVPGRRIGTPHDVRAYLADPIKHWKPEWSAYELAHAWVVSDNLPSEVADLLRDSYGECELVEGLFEKETVLPTRGAGSHTDLLLLLKAATGDVVVGVEGKVREPFDKKVREWNDGGWGKRTRLADLCRRLDLDPAAVGELRYQLLHRTVATVLEAARYGAADAVMLVHSFDPGDASFEDFRAFAEALGLSDAAPGKLSAPIALAGINLRLGWARSPAKTAAES
jgi:hypothetical protein